MLICIFTGFSSGLPLCLLLSLVPAWLTTKGIDLEAIGLLTLFQLPYILKFLWAPLLDRYSMPWLGRRRSWMVIMQLALLGGIVYLGQISPQGLAAPPWGSVAAFASHPVTLAYLFIVLASATQDIALDAYRRELLPDHELGLGNSVHVIAYRIASLVPGSLSLILAARWAADPWVWNKVFFITALFMLPGLVMTLLVSEKTDRRSMPKTLREAVVEPFHEFFTRAGWREALLVLAFIFFYKLGDSLCVALATPFYLKMGFSMEHIGLVAKHASLWPAVIGGLLGGLWMVKLGINRALWLFGALQLVAIFGFAWLAWLGPAASVGAAQLAQLALVTGCEAFCVSLGTTAFVAFISRATNPLYTATQFALFSGLAAVSRSIINAGAGYLVKQFGWFSFFLLCVLLAVPGMLLLFRVAPWKTANT